MEETGVMSLILPELSACRGVQQKGRHRHDVLDHLLHTCAASTRESVELMLAGLLHDVGKPAVRAIDNDGIYTFHGHEIASARIAHSIMTRLKFPNRTIARVVHLIEQHMFHYETTWTDAAVRRFIARVGVDEIEPLFALRAADSRAISGIPGVPPEIDELRARIAKILEAHHAFSLKDLAVNGTDLREASIPSGPITGIVLKELLSAVIDDPALNDKERLLDIARAFVRERGLLQG
jgi:tRNA nucleotidyltransferase/poly(A) polymerase